MGDVGAGVGAMPRFALPLLLAACAPDQVTPEPLQVARSTVGAAPAIGGEDSADHSCALVFRSAARVLDADGEPEQRCEDDACSWVWTVEVDVSTALLADGAATGLLYHQAADPGWREVQGTPGAPEADGYTPVTYVISDHLPGPDDGDTSVEFIPFTRDAEGARRFDHNVNEGDLDNYWLGPDLSLTGDAYVCTHLVDVAYPWFAPDWSEGVTGELRVGNALSVTYDLDRLPECRNTHNGYPAWDTTAFVRFEPSGQTVSGSVRAIVYDQGRPTNQAVSAPFVATVPPGTTSAALWFNNASGAGSSCSTWDSNLGANYVFDVKPAPADDPCWGQLAWSDVHTEAATCPSYAVSEQVDATACELAVDAFGLGLEAHYGIPFRWLEAWLSVGPQDGTVVGAGLYSAFQDRSDGTLQERWSYGREVEPGRWKTGLTTQFTGYMGEGSYRYDVESFAFFVDVRRPDGRVVRRWQSRGGANYTLDDAFALPTSAYAIPYGNIQYANPDAGVFDALRDCR